jgi:hypothetical protein
MVKKPFSVWRDQHAESEWNYVCFYDVRRKEDIKHATRKNLTLASRMSEIIRAAHREQHGALRRAQDVTEIRRIMGGIEISMLEDYPSGWVNLPKFRRAQCSGANLVGLTSRYHCDGDFVLVVPGAPEPAAPLRNSPIPKAPPSTPPPGEWKHRAHP